MTGGKLFGMANFLAFRTSPRLNLPCSTLGKTAITPFSRFSRGSKITKSFAARCIKDVFPKADIYSIIGLAADRTPTASMQEGPYRARWGPWEAFWAGNLFFESVKAMAKVWKGECGTVDALQSLVLGTGKNFAVGLAIKAIAKLPVVASILASPAVHKMFGVYCCSLLEQRVCTLAFHFWKGCRHIYRCRAGGEGFHVREGRGPMRPIPEWHFMEPPFQCPVGISVMDLPQVLSCGHTFDASAISHIQNVCFTCRQPAAWVAPNTALLAARATCVAASEQHLLPRGFLQDGQGRLHRNCWVDRDGASFAEEGVGRVRNFKLEEAQDAWIAHFHEAEALNKSFLRHFQGWFSGYIRFVLSLQIVSGLVRVLKVSSKKQ